MLEMQTPDPRGHLESGARFPETERRWEEAVLEKRNLRKDPGSAGAFLLGKRDSAREGHSTGSQSSVGSDPSQAAHYQHCGGGGQVGGFV